jgi:polar amino acid transport system substrate-binding protein
MGAPFGVRFFCDKIDSRPNKYSQKETMRNHLFLLIGMIFSISAYARETITLIAEDDWFPYSAATKDGPKGFAIDVLTAAYNAAGADVTFKNLPFARCMNEVKLGNELGCFDTVKEDIHQNDYVFHAEPLFTARLAIYVRSDSTETNLTFKSLEGKTVGITNGYTYGNEFENNKKINRDVAVSDEISLKKLALGRLKYAIVYEKAADYIIGKNKDKVENKIKVGGIGKADEMYVSFSKKHPGTEKAKALLNKGLKTIHENGKYLELEKAFAERLKKGL